MSTFVGNGLYSPTTTGNASIDTEVNPIVNAQQLSRYTIYRTSGGTYKLKDWQTGTTTTNTTSFDSLLNPLLSALTSGACINILGGDGLSGTFIVKNPILLPVKTGNGLPVRILGGFGAGNRSNSVTFQADPSFPSGRFMIEGLGIPATGTAGMAPNLQISDIFFYNPNFAPNGTVDSTHPNVGGINMEFDSSAGLVHDYCRIENCMFQYMYQGIQLAGFLYYARLNRLNFDDASTSFVGDYDIKFYQGTAGHADHPPKVCHISYITSHHKDAIMNNSLWMEGAYNVIFDYFVDGYCFQESVWGLHGEGDGCHNNVIIRPMIFDNGFVPTPDNRKAAMYINGANCYNNRVVFASLTATPYMLMFDNSAYRNYVKLGYFGAVVNVKDNAAGTLNRVEVEEGSAASGTANTKITTTASNVAIIDGRTGASNAGMAQGSGNGSNPTFTINHGLFTTPLWATVTPGSAVANAPYYVSALSSTTITLTYTTAPASGTNNLTWYWRASVYPSG